jgi:hypothetical protein
VKLEGGRERASVSSKDPFRDDESSDSFRRLFLYVYSSDSIIYSRLVEGDLSILAFGEISVRLRAWQGTVRSQGHEMMVD